MREIIKLDNNTICIKANFDKTPTNNFDEQTRPNPDAVKIAHETLNDLQWRLYANLCNFTNRGVGIAPITKLMNELEMNEDEFRSALFGLVSHRYLNFAPVYYYGKVYTGNALVFHPDNSLVGLRGDSFTKESINKPFWYTGDAEVIEEF